MRSSVPGAPLCKVRVLRLLCPASHDIIILFNVFSKRLKHVFSTGYRAECSDVFLFEEQSFWRLGIACARSCLLRSFCEVQQCKMLYFQKTTLP